LELGQGEGDQEDDRALYMSRREMKMKRNGIPRRREETIGGSGVSGTPAPNRRPKIRHDTQYYEETRRY